MTSPSSPATLGSLSTLLLQLAERMPVPYEEDRFYSESEQARLLSDIRLIQEAATEIDRLRAGWIEADKIALEGRKKEAQPLGASDEPLRELCYDYRNATTAEAESYFQRIVRWVKQQAQRSEIESPSDGLQKLLGDLREPRLGIHEDGTEELKTWGALYQQGLDAASALEALATRSATRRSILKEVAMNYVAADRPVFQAWLNREIGDE